MHLLVRKCWLLVIHWRLGFRLRRLDLILRHLRLFSRLLQALCQDRLPLPRHLLGVRGTVLGRNHLEQRLGGLSELVLPEAVAQPVQQQRPVSFAVTG